MQVIGRWKWEHFLPTPFWLSVVALMCCLGVCVHLTFTLGPLNLLHLSHKILCPRWTGKERHLASVAQQPLCFGDWNKQKSSVLERERERGRGKYLILLALPTKAKILCLDSF